MSEKTVSSLKWEPIIDTRSAEKDQGIKTDIDESVNTFSILATQHQKHFSEKKLTYTKTNVTYVEIKIRKTDIDQKQAHTSQR